MTTRNGFTAPSFHATLLRLHSAALVAGLALGFAATTPAAAADWSYKAPAAPSTYTSDFGLRFWYGSGKTGKTLFDDTGALTVSRLSYDGFSIFTAEGFTRFDLSSGWFLKGYAGGGALLDGQLKDEDFPPVIAPYSATLSPIKNSSMSYGSVDLGFKLVRGGDFYIGAFAGYHFMRQSISAYGCTQVASNPDVCVPTIPDSIKVISQNNNWHSLRVGIDAAIEFDRRWKLSVDAAWLPYVWLAGSDAHWLRIGPSPGDFTGPVPEDGHGRGYQIDSFLSYRVNDFVGVGLGGRYWHMQADGHTHFENHVVGFTTVPQVVNWKTDNYGVFLQSSVRLGPHGLFGSN
jgi:outer membrane protease